MFFMFSVKVLDYLQDQRNSKSLFPSLPQFRCIHPLENKEHPVIGISYRPYHKDTLKEMIPQILKKLSVFGDIISAKECIGNTSALAIKISKRSL